MSVLLQSCFFVILPICRFFSPKYPNNQKSHQVCCYVHFLPCCDSNVAHVLLCCLKISSHHIRVLTKNFPELHMLISLVRLLWKCISLISLRCAMCYTVILHTTYFNVYSRIILSSETKHGHKIINL